MAEARAVLAHLSSTNGWGAQERVMARVHLKSLLDHVAEPTTPSEPNELADRLEEATTVLGEPFHRETVTYTMLEAAVALRTPSEGEIL